MCYCCPSCNCCMRFFRSCIGKLLVWIISFCTIALGIVTIWGYYWTSDQVIFKITISDTIATTSKVLGLCLGIGMIIFGISGIFGLIYRKSIKGKILLFIYVIGSFLVFICMLILGAIVIAVVTNTAAVSDYLCSNSNSTLPIIMYDNIKARTSPSTICPSKCTSPNTDSKKLEDCTALQQTLNVPVSKYTASNFLLLETLESNFNCAGICSKHQGIPCTYFNNFAQKNTQTCVSSIQETLKKYDIIIIIIFSISIFVSLFNIFAAISLLCASREEKKLIKT